MSVRPKIPAKLRSGWGRYRLSTLFIVVAFVGIALGWMRREGEFRQQHEHLESIQPLADLANEHLTAHYRARLKIREPGDGDSWQWGTISSRALIHLHGPPSVGSGRSIEDTFVFHVESTFLVSLMDDSATQQFSDYYQFSIYSERDPDLEDVEPDHVILVRYQGEKISVFQNDKIELVVEPEVP